MVLYNSANFDWYLLNGIQVWDTTFKTLATVEQSVVVLKHHAFPDCDCKGQGHMVVKIDAICR